jgi:hypothetical protein
MQEYISVRYIPVELSPGGSFSKDVFVYENPTPAGESRNSRLAAEIPPDSLHMLPLSRLIKAKL